MKEQRKEPRRLFIARAKLLWEEPAGHSRLATALIEDRSDNGMSVRVKQEISIGSKLEIRWHKAKLSGIVLECRPVGVEYILAIRRDLDNPYAGEPE